MCCKEATYYKLGAQNKEFCYKDIFHAQDSEELAILIRNASVHLYLQVGFVINLAKPPLSR